MALIGISGKISSGKDTVGKIIRILTASPHFTNEAVVDFLKRDLYESNWKIRKFADKLKDIVCILLGCTREHSRSIFLKYKIMETKEIVELMLNLLMLLTIKKIYGIILC